LLCALPIKIAAEYCLAQRAMSFGEHRISYFVYPRYLHFLFPVWFLVRLFKRRDTKV